MATGVRFVAKSLVAFLENFPKILSREARPVAFWIRLFWIVVDLLCPAVASSPKSRTVGDALSWTMGLSSLAS